MNEKIQLWPAVNTVWRHYNGNEYVVLMHSNIEEEREEKYPRTVVYQNIKNKKVYSRKLIDWHRSMSIINND